MELAGAVVGATVQVVLQNIIKSIQEIISMAWNYKDYLQDLKRSLEMVQGYLSFAKANKVSIVKLWLNRLEDVAFEAYAVLDVVKYKLLRSQVKNKEVLGFLNSGPRRIMFKLKMSGEIKDVLKKLKKINEEAKDYGLQSIVAASQINTFGLITPNERETDSFSVEASVQGRDKDVDNMVEILITAQPDAKVSVIPIWGMGGIGKTTVAQKVFHDKKIENHFGLKMWACVGVSSSFDSLSLLQLILGTFPQELVESTRQSVLRTLKERLEGKRYLLVLDDVWDENTGGWEEFKNTLSNISSNEGNCIVVTTRNKSVASHVGTRTTYELSRLSVNECWSIIKAKSYGGEDVPKEFEKIGINIARKCDGLPLDAKVIGSLLRGKSKEDWDSILENKLFDRDDENITKILRVSYDILPTLSLKECFAYCSVFPQNYTIKRQEMVELWMAEGFLQGGHEGDMETEGSEVMNRLLQYSLLQDANKDIFGDIIDCKMHDSVHELACSITKDTKVRYLALKSAETNEPKATSKMKHLRTMFFEGEIANSMFSNFSCLHVLKLTAREIKELPSGIEKLIHLRSLDVSATQVKRLPDSVGKLYHLQTLLINQARNWTELPNSVINLISLRHLHISANTKLPPSIGKLTSLRTLKYYKVRDENGWRIEELGSLKNLKGELKIENLEMVKDKEEAKKSDLSRKPGIFKLTLEWNESSDRVGHHENVLDGLQPHQRLKSLEIIGYKGKTLPSWTMCMADIEFQAFNSLVEIKLKGFAQCEELPMLGHLRHLKFLVLENWSDLRNVGLPFYGNGNLSVLETVFPALESLKMYHMPELTEWVEMKAVTKVFPRLKYLRIDDCPKLASVHSHFPCLERFEADVADLSLTNLFNITSSLQELSIVSCKGLKWIPNEVNLTSLRVLYIAECKGLTELPVELLESCILSLESLTLWKLENLENLHTLVPCLGRMLRLQILKIAQIPKFTIIPTEFVWLMDLGSLEIGGFSEPLNVDQLASILQKCPSLEYLDLYRHEKHLNSLIKMHSVQQLCVGQF